MLQEKRKVSATMMPILTMVERDEEPCWGCCSASASGAAAAAAVAAAAAAAAAPAAAADAEV